MTLRFPAFVTAPPEATHYTFDKFDGYKFYCIVEPKPPLRLRLLKVWKNGGWEVVTGCVPWDDLRPLNTHAELSELMRVQGGTDVEGTAARLLHDKDAQIHALNRFILRVGRSLTEGMPPYDEVSDVSMAVIEGAALSVRDSREKQAALLTYQKKYIQSLERRI